MVQLVVVSGRSGSGKSVCLEALEDLGFYCVDNLPIDLMDNLVGRLSQKQVRLAISVDIRNLSNQLDALKQSVSQVNLQGGTVEMIYLDARDDVLLKRFSETRRRHPLTREGLTLSEAILRERTLLQPLAQLTDLTIDTSELSKHILCELIRERFSETTPHTLQIQIKSFAFKNGLPADVDYVFDVRCLPNPYWKASLRPLTGLDPAVVQYLRQFTEVTTMIEHLVDFLQNWIPKFQASNRSYLTIGIGCTGGQHRSVYIANEVFNHLSGKDYKCQIRHREL